MGSGVNELGGVTLASWIKKILITTSTIRGEWLNSFMKGNKICTGATKRIYSYLYLEALWRGPAQDLQFFFVRSH